MKTTNKIFTGTLDIARRLAMLAAFVTMPAMAATDNGCLNELNDYVNPMVALCSTHVYNIGGTENPDDPATRELMNDVVALKTTLITQQMNKQYEYLESMLRRLKTQMEKAILTTNLQAAGADKDGDSSSSSSSRYRGTDPNIHINGVENCSNKGTTSEILVCLQRNHATLLAVTNSGTRATSDANKQLAREVEIAKMYVDTNFRADMEKECKNVSNKTFSKCMDSLIAAIRNQQDKRENDARKYSRD